MLRLSSNSASSATGRNLLSRRQLPDICRMVEACIMLALNYRDRMELLWMLSWQPIRTICLQ